MSLRLHGSPVQAAPYFPAALAAFVLWNNQNRLEIQRRMCVFDEAPRLSVPWFSHRAVWPLSRLVSSLSQPLCNGEQHQAIVLVCRASTMRPVNVPACEARVGASYHGLSHQEESSSRALLSQINPVKKFTDLRPGTLFETRERKYCISLKAPVLQRRGWARRGWQMTDFPSSSTDRFLLTARELPVTDVQKRDCT